MHDEVLVGVLHRLTYRAEQLETAAHGKRRGVFQQRRAVHVLHHEIRQARLGGAAVEQARDVGVLQSGQDLPLRTETAQGGFRIGTALEQLDRDLHAEVVRARAAIDHRHATLPDQAVDGEMANTRAGEQGVSVRGTRPRFACACRGMRLRQVHRRLREKVAHVFFRGQEGVDAQT